MIAILALFIAFFTATAQAETSLDYSVLAALPVQHEGRVKPLESLARIYFKNEKQPVAAMAKALFLPDSLDEKSTQKYAPFAFAFAAYTPVYEGKSYADLRAKVGEYESKLKAIIKHKGEDLNKYTKDEQKIATLSYLLARMREMGSQSDFFRILPSPQGQGIDWVSPWMWLEGGYGSPITAPLMQQWRNLATAYRAHDAVGWNQSAAAIAVQMQQQTAYPQWKLKLEQLYLRAGLYSKAVILYALAFLLLLLPKMALTNWPLRAYGLAMLLHGAAISARIAILGRPPVSNLHESILFVSLVVALGGLWLYRRRELKEGMAIGAVLAGGLLAVSDFYAPEGDRLGVLIAVLNTNFWLATHVICITIGYATSAIAGTLAHLALLERFHARLKSLLPFATVVALLFTAVGTILGGIWADQSWGRFWGWDPKENGALLIVLWLIWLLHGRMSVLSDRSFTALLAITNIIVALSWFGVNLLNTGLHSYGFTEAAVYGLVGFCVVETMLIFALAFWPRKIKQNA